MSLHRLRLWTRGGVEDLGRVVNVLCLLDLTPVSLTAVAKGDGLQIDAWLSGEERQLSLCLARLRAVSAVSGASLTVPGSSTWSCETLSR